MVLMALVAAVTSYCINDLNASGAQEWSVLFCGPGWSHGRSVNGSSRRQALLATRGRLWFVLELGAGGDALGGGTQPTT